MILQGTSVGAMTDVNGAYTIPNVKPGTYNLVISFVTYKSHVVPEVVVEAAKITTIDVAMVEDAQQLEEIVVQGTREINTDMAMVTAIKESKLVVTGISAQQISKSQDRDAAQVVRRVPGVTLVDNRFVIVRGLASRYTTVLLNGVVAPSTETDSRAFSFDIVPSGLLDRMLVYKSGAAHLPGDFAGSIVGVNTKTAIENNFTNISLSGGVRANTTFNTFISQERSSSEFLGFGGSLRKLPSGAPSNYNSLGTDVSRIEAETRKFNNSWGTTSSTAIPDIRMSLDLGRSFYIKEMKVNTVNSLSYSNTNQYNKIAFNRYSNYSNGVGQPYFAFEDDQYTNNVRLGLLSNWAFHLTPNSKIEFKNLYTRIGSSISTFRTGTDIDKGQDVQNGSFRYIERSIYTGQLEGKHTLKKDKSSVSWILGYTSASRNEPDWKRYSYRRNQGTENEFELFVPTNAANPANAARFYQKLNEFNLTNRLDFDYKFGASSEKPYELKAGYWVEYKNRSFAARQIGFVQRGNIDLSTFKLPIDQIFVPENIAYQNGFSVAESTNITDSYDANALLAAGYVSVDMPISDVIQFTLGFRVEHNTIHLETPKGTGGAEIDYPVTSLLPFANLAFNMTTNSLIRLAYSKTINRPEFRELAPFSFYDFDAQLDIVGNKELKVADIHNVDLRWEYYPTPDEFISVGAFYKNFKNPIETRIVTGANNPIQFFQNAKGANNAGLEVEIRKAIAYSSPSKLLNDLSVIFNASYIVSEIELVDDGTLTEKVKRPMQGQSPYVINAGLYYQNDESGLQISSQYNVFGKRIAFVGDKEFPTQWEMPRHVVDLTISKTIGQKTELRIGVSDLLNAPLILKEDANLDNKLDNPGSDKLVRETRNGQYFNLGVVMKL